MRANGELTYSTLASACDLLSDKSTGRTIPRPRHRKRVKEFFLRRNFLVPVPGKQELASYVYRYLVDGNMTADLQI